MPDVTTVLLIFLGVLNFLCLIVLFQIKNELDSSRETIDAQLKRLDSHTPKILEPLILLQASSVVVEDRIVAMANEIERVHDDVSRLSITLDTQLKDLAALIPSARYSDNNFKVPVQRVNADGTTTVELREPIKRREPIKDDKVLQDLNVQLWGRQ